MSNQTKTMAMAAGGLGLTGLGLSLLHRDRALRSYRGKTVLITGGSRGLGLAMARELRRVGARLILCARNQSELDSACSELGALGIQCDVSVRHQVEAMIHRAGRIDVLINNAGNIFVGPLESVELEQFEDAMGTIFWGTVYCTQTVLPQMLRRGSGWILNVTSIGGRVTVPHLLPYCTAKYAAVSFTEGLRQEMAPRGLHVTLGVPGFMRTGSYDNANFMGQQKQEYSWFSLCSSTPGLTIPADTAARRLLVALARNQSEERVSPLAEMLARFKGTMPRLFNELAGAVGSRVLPGPDGKAPPRKGEQIAREAPGWLHVAQTLGKAAQLRYQAYKESNLMTKTMTKNGPSAMPAEPMNRGSELISTPGFTIGLGLGLLVGAVTSGLLMTKAGSDLVMFLESKTSELKDKASEMLESSELKDKAVELMRGKAAQTLMSVKDTAADKITGAIETAAEKLTTVVEKTASLGEPESAGTRLEQEEQEDGKVSAGKASGKSSSSGGGAKSHGKDGGGKS